MATRITPRRSRHILYGHQWNHTTNVQDTWRKYGWLPKEEADAADTVDQAKPLLALPNPDNPSHRQIGFIHEVARDQAQGA